MALFKPGDFTAHSGITLPWKVNCDALTYKDWECVASIASALIGPFGNVEGVPLGGFEFAEALREYSFHTSPSETRYTELLIVDDVLTTGDSMNRWRGGRKATGIVLFARGTCPDWVTPIWTLTPAS